MAGRESIDANVRDGGHDAAFLHSVGANAEHSALRRTNADKRKAVGMLLARGEWRAQSNTLVADKARVSASFVSKVREELTQHGVESPTVRKGADGRDVDTTKIKRERKEKSVAKEPSGAVGHRLQSESDDDQRQGAVESPQADSSTNAEEQQDADTSTEQSAEQDKPVAASPKSQPESDDDQGQGAVEGPQTDTSTKAEEQQDAGPSAEQSAEQERPGAASPKSQPESDDDQGQGAVEGPQTDTSTKAEEQQDTGPSAEQSAEQERPGAASPKPQPESDDDQGQGAAESPQADSSTNAGEQQDAGPSAEQSAEQERPGAASPKPQPESDDDQGQGAAESPQADSSTNAGEQQHAGRSAEQPAEDVAVDLEEGLRVASEAYDRVVRDHVSRIQKEVQEGAVQVRDADRKLDEVLSSAARIAIGAQKRAIEIVQDARVGLGSLAKEDDPRPPGDAAGPAPEASPPA
jgi:hypothetical protein